MPLLFATLLVFASIARFVPHPPNFAPIGALGIFAGLYIKDKRWAIGLPLLARLVSDALIGFFTPGVMLSVYLATAIGSLLGILAKKKKNLLTVASATLVGSVCFFILTNFAVWQFDKLYPHTFAGLSSCFIAAIPFFRNTLLGDMFYVSVLVGGAELVRTIAKRRKIKWQTSNY